VFKISFSHGNRRMMNIMPAPVCRKHI